MANREFRVDWAKKHYAVWRKHLKPWAIDRSAVVDDMAYLEIGVFEGRSACFMLDNVLPDNAMAWLVDDWQHYRQLGSSRWNRLVDNGDSSSIQARAARNLAEYADRVRWMDGSSGEVLKSLVGMGSEFDLIYVDGGHSASQCWVDTSLSWHLLKAGGLMIWDDMQFRAVSRTVAGFRSAMRRMVKDVYRTEYQLCVRKVG